LFSTLCAALLLNGCGFLFGDDGVFPDNSSDYLNAAEASALVLPEDMDADLPADQYVIPELEFSNVLPDKYEVPRVEPLDNIESKGSVVIQSFKGEQWVLIKRSPAQTWPLVLQFLQSNQIPLLYSSAEKGVIETGWLRDKYAGTQDKFNNIQERSGDERYQFVLKHGVQRLTTEIVVKQADRKTEKLQGQLWKESSSQVRQENMVTLLAEHLAGSPDQSSHSLLAQGIGSVSKVSLEYHADGQPFIHLQLPFDRGWGSLKLALTKAGFVVDDLNREKGIYYTKFVPKAKKKKAGFIRRTFRFFAFWKSTKEETAFAQYQIRTVDKNSYLEISIARDGEPALQSNEQAFLLRKIVGKLS